MSIQAVAWALEQDIPAHPKLVLVAIANHADHTNGYCWLKAATIAREASCVPRSVWRYVGALVRNSYLRKSPRKAEDGRQRANDYWIMFGRDQKPWSWDGNGHDPEPDEGDLSDSVDPQDVDGPCDSLAHGPEVKPCDSGVIRLAVEKPQESHGPCDSGVTRIESAEPSKTKSKESEPVAARGGSGLVVGPPRTYQPPPLEAQGAEQATDKGRQVFVFERSRAWDAWSAHWKQTRGVYWTRATSSRINGQQRTGWWFPSLFPPGHQQITEDQKFIARNGGL